MLKIMCDNEQNIIEIESEGTAVSRVKELAIIVRALFDEISDNCSQEGVNKVRKLFMSVITDPEFWTLPLTEHGEDVNGQD